MISNYLKLLRFKEWLPAFLSIIIGYILTKSFALKDLFIILIAFIPFFLIGSFGFIINEYFDREFDKKKKNNINPISTGHVSKRSSIILASLFAILGVGISYFLLQRVFLLFLIGFVALFVHSSPPFRFKEKLGLDVISSCSCSPVLFLAGYTLFLEINIPIIMLAIEFFILCITLEILNEIKDYNADKASGFKTTAICLGVENSIKLIRVTLMSFIVLFSLTIYMYFPLYFLISIISLSPLVHIVFSKDVTTRLLNNSIITASVNRCNILLILIVLILLPLWYGLI